MKINDTIIAFDLHSVLFKPNWREVGHILWHYKHKLSILACAFKPRLVYKSLRLLANDPTDEEFFALFEQHCPHLMQLAIDLMNAHRLMTPMINLVKELKAKGYALHIISNIGPRRYPTLCSRFPELMAHFDKAKTVYAEAKAIIKKPNPEFFKTYLRDFNPDHKSVIFIDDNKRNINVAKSFGFVCIRFTKPEHLRTQLASLGIL